MHITKNMINIMSKINFFKLSMISLILFFIDYILTFYYVSKTSINAESNYYLILMMSYYGISKGLILAFLTFCFFLYITNFIYYQYTHKGINFGLNIGILSILILLIMAIINNIIVVLL